MVECDYCEASFEAEEEYLVHLRDAHEGELGSIDQRRVSELESGSDGGVATGTIVLGLVLVVAVGLVAYLTMFSGGGSSSDTVNGIQVAQTPGSVGTVHEHGTMNVTIDGQRVDFSQPQYQVAADPFHFENGNGRVWHTHAQGVTLEYAMATLGIEVTNDSVTYQGTTYTDGGGTEVTVAVNREPVDPSTYVLQGVGSNSGEGGDHVRIVMTTSG